MLVILYVVAVVVVVVVEPVLVEEGEEANDCSIDAGDSRLDNTLLLLILLWLLPKEN